MKPSIARMLDELTQDAQPTEKEPDFTGWTRREIVDWQIAHMDYHAAVRQARLSPAPEPKYIPREQFTAWDARDAAILAERAAKAAAERLAERPGTAAAQINARATREAADKAARAAEAAERLAEEAKLRPPPVENPDAPGPGAATIETEAKPKRQPPPPREPEPEPEPKPKEWWEERAHWRKRSPREEENARRGRPLYKCIYEYDPIDYFYAEQAELEEEDEQEDDYDPFE